MAHLTKLLTGLILSTALSGALTGCALTSAGVKKGDERNFVRSLNDISAGRVIEARMKRALDYNLKGVDVEAAEGVVLLSGNVPDQKDRIEAARIAWSALNVDQVGNEIKINDKQGFVRNTKDGLLEKSVRTRLTVDKYVKARNFNVETHDGIVYLLGVARDERELERAARIASTTRGAAEVISYARVAGIPSRNDGAPAGVAQSVAQSAGQSFPSQNIPSQGFSSQNIPSQRDLPGFVTNAPSAVQAPSPIRSLPLSAPIPFNAPSASSLGSQALSGQSLGGQSLGGQSLGGQSFGTQALGQQAFGGPTAPPQIDIGERLGKELPSNEELGAYRTGGAGEAVSVIESAPYYVDPETGKEIPVRFDSNGNWTPLIIK